MAVLHQRCFTTPRPWSQNEIAALIEEPAVFVVSRSGGFALGRTVADEAELLTLAVPPEDRRAGIGRALLAAYEEKARSRGAQESFLEVAADNHAAVALYEQAGYGPRGQRRGYYRRPDGTRCDAIVLRRCL